MMHRKDFLTKLVRSVLFVLTATLLFFLGRKSVPGSDCSACPGKGSCNGDSDCSRFKK